MTVGDGVTLVVVRLDRESDLDDIFVRYLLAVDPGDVTVVWAMIDAHLAVLRRQL